MFTYPFYMLYLNLSTLKTLFLTISVIVSIILLFNYSLFQENTSHDNLFIESNKFIKDKQTEVDMNVDRLSYNIFTNPSSQNISPKFVSEVAEEGISNKDGRKYSNIINQKLAKNENNIAKIKREIEKRRTRIKDSYYKFTTNPLASIEVIHENLENKKILNVSNISYNRRRNENTKEFFSNDDEFDEKNFIMKAMILNQKI
ncbi:hypothetical protein H311_03720 [Anncaliia algerae PRA109]|nr:hypothetical protein H311_03720 [Anncaliia algerae PRA109]